MAKKKKKISKRKNKNQVFKAFGLVGAAAFLGSMATMVSVATWYPTLKKPPLVPPGFVFGIAWTILYILMATAFYLILRRGVEKSQSAIRAFVLQLGLNVLWSFGFFGLQNPVVGIVIIFLLDAAVIWTVFAFYKRSKLAAYLMLPYLAWIIFATYLNWMIALLNF